MPPALLDPPAFRADDGVPLSVLVDYDGTISTRDIGDELLARHFPDPALVAGQDQAYDEGRISSRALMAWDMEVLPRDAALLRRTAASVPQDPAFPSFVAWMWARGGLVEVVSDGLGFYIESNLAAQDPALAGLPVATNQNRVAGAGGLSFPYGHPACDACGTCKRERVRRHRAAGRVVVMVGDGTTDRYAAHEADVVFAKGKLAAWCTASAEAFVPWATFSDVAAWIAVALGDGRLPARGADLAAWRAARDAAEPLPGEPRRRAGVPPICGPEVGMGTAETGGG